MGTPSGIRCNFPEFGERRSTIALFAVLSTTPRVQFRMGASGRRAGIYLLNGENRNATMTYDTSFSEISGP